VVGATGEAYEFSEPKRSGGMAIIDTPKLREEGRVQNDAVGGVWDGEVECVGTPRLLPLDGGACSFIGRTHPGVELA
jgi:hypothetical protein